jgi:hypothetical protein
MARIDIKSAGGGGASLDAGILQLENGVAMDATLRSVTDQNNTISPLKLSTTLVQTTSTLKITTADNPYIDAEDNSGNNRFTIGRDPSSQIVNVDFASNPTGSTSQVGAIRTYQDGTNLSDVVKFREDGQVTFTERVNVEADSLVTTESCSVIAASTTNANLVIAPNGTGALIASIPDGTSTGGNARGDDAVDLQLIRSAATNVASGNYSTISGGQSNTASSTHSTVSGGESNVASTNTHATVLGGQSNVSSGIGSVSGGISNTASSTRAVAIGSSNTASGIGASMALGNGNSASADSAVAIGRQNTATSSFSCAFGSFNNVSGTGSVAIGNNNTISASNGFCLGKSTSVTSPESGTAIGLGSTSYLYAQSALGSGNFTGQIATQQSLLTARQEAILTTGGTAILSLDGTGVTNLIIPTGINRMWNVQVRWVAVVTTITGTATGVTVGDTKVSTDLLAVAKRGGVTTVSAHTSAGTQVIETTAGSLTAVNIVYSAGASQEMAITFTGPTFLGGGSVTMRIVAAISLTEVSY